MAGFAFYSGALLHTAHRAAGRAEGDPDQSLIALVCAAASLEAFVNECLDYIQEPELSKDTRFDQMRAIASAADLSARNASLHTKIQLLSAGLSGHEFPRGEQPFQDFDLLVSLRNALLHQRMERMPGDDAPDVQPIKAVERAKARGLVAPEQGVMTSIMAIVSVPTVARWAVEASANMAKAVAKLLPAHSQNLLAYTILKFPDLGVPDASRK